MPLLADAPVGEQLVRVYLDGHSFERLHRRDDDLGGRLALQSPQKRFEELRFHDLSIVSNADER